MECGNYPGSKLLEHGMKGIKRQLEGYWVVGRMQFGPMPGKLS